MADQRCPQCNSLNPGDAEKCWNCEAPLLASESSESGAGPLDWLSDLRSGSDLEDIRNEAEANPEDKEDLPDWLKRVRQRSDSERENDDFSDEAVSAGDELPDWLKDLTGEPHDEQSTSRSEEDTIPPPAGGIESQDWFQGLADFSSEKKPDTGDEGVPEWLLEDSDETQPSTTPASGEEMAAFSDGDLPDWIAESNKEDTSLPAPGADETAIFKSSDLADWLSEIPGEEEPETPAVPTGETALYRPGEDLPDWLSELPKATDTEPEPLDMTGDETAIFSGDDLPDWLSELNGESEPNAQSPAGDETAAFRVDDLPDWLSGIDEATETTPVQPSPAEELPSWLLADENQAVQPEETSEWKPEDEAVSFSTDTNWFEKLGAGAAGAGLPEGEASESQDLEGEPTDNEFELDQAVSETEEIVDPSIAEEPEPETPAEEEDFAVAAFELEDLPDWLSEESVDVPQSEPTSVTPAFIMDEGDELDETEIEQAHPFSEEDIPAWLTAEEEITTDEVESEDLTRTTLPNWVEAMRPVETVALSGATASNEEIRTEKAGPLAGLTGVLPAEVSAIDYGRPPTYSMRLRVSDKQRASAALLETVLEEESKPRELQREKPGTSQAILRLLVGILLITVILLSGGLTNVAQPPNSGSTNVIHFAQRMETLPIGGTVLLAVDFDPGYSSEMSLAGRGVIQQLLARDNKLVIVSTSVAGPVLAEELVLGAMPEDITRNDRVINLGFLPGGIISLKEFTLAPRTAARYGMDWVRTGQPAWQHPYLQNVHQITDFSLVLVLTDSGDTGRMWLEQVKPNIGAVPMMMVTTAQAAPILHPYLTGGQLDGLISGLSGGRSYSHRLSAAEYENTWAAFRAGVLVTIALIFIGILFRGIASLIPVPKA
jgi:hypothetical protein